MAYGDPRVGAMTGGSDSGPGSDRAKDILRHFEQLEGDRGVWNSHWQEVADRVYAKPTGFITQVTQGAKWTQKIFDATACHALQRFAAAVESVICPRAEKWHTLAPQDPALAEHPAVKRWCEALTDLLFRVRYGSRSAFASESQECFLEMGAFGTMGMLVDDIANHVGVYPQPVPIVYQAVPLAGFWIEENSLGQVDTVYRKFELDGRQAVMQFGAENLNEKVVEDAKQQKPRKWEFIHAVHPTKDRTDYAWDWRRFPYSSCYVLREAKKLVSEAGYRRHPYAVSRSITTAGEQYGRSPAMTVLPDIKMLNEISKTMIRAAHKLVDPPLLLADDGMGSAFDLRPNALNYGHVDLQGHQLVHPLQTGANLEVGGEMRQDVRTSINDAFLITLFQILVENKEMTAYEAALRAQEKGQLLAPTMGRQESEFLAPMIEREIDILWNRGIIQATIGPPPRELVATGAALKIVFENQMTQFQRAPEAARTLMAMQQLTPLASIDPTVMDIFDPEGVATVILNANGVPQKARRTPEQLAALKQQRIDQQAADRALAAAPVAAQAANDLTQANLQAQSQPPRLPLAA
ncbi:MAG TPA: portal protein [Chloroflexota bacterium]|nr:portal protein [Chloroflexota bacterium]